MKMNDDLFAVIVTFMIMGFFGSILIYVAITKTDDALGEWTAFKQEHSCHLISVDNARANYGWLCADGITYYNRFAE